MKRTLSMLLILAAASLSLTASNCLSTKTVDVPVRGSIQAPFHTQSDGTPASDSLTVDLGPILEDVEAEGAFETLVDASIENGYWKVLANNGVSATTVSGMLSVRRGSGSLQPLIEIDAATLGTGDADYRVATLNPGGVELLNQGLDDYLAWKNSTGGAPELQYTFRWTLTSDQPLDFDWAARIKFVMVGQTSVDVPEVF